MSTGPAIRMVEDNLSLLPNTYTQHCTDKQCGSFLYYTSGTKFCTDVVPSRHKGRECYTYDDPYRHMRNCIPRIHLKSASARSYKILV